MIFLKQTITPKALNPPKHSRLNNPNYPNQKQEMKNTKLQILNA
ncbi:hypothetical protein SAMN05444008_11626 [Cnuella takakiae]|uniref:Uncharacterized protein n=1 Tax=Cnuella takakiae TaxID=1302690 RepID=A0A1M5GD76_9BACT|nr:hypothetical protein SAMN05444008_11626 [Cnuella takakiae]